MNEIRRSLPHGHVAAVLGTLLNLGLESLISPQKSRQRDLVTAMVVARIQGPRIQISYRTGILHTDIEQHSRRTLRSRRSIPKMNSMKRWIGLVNDKRKSNEV